MDWNVAIERNREALKRILASLVAMAGLPVLLGRGDAATTGGRTTLPRHLHRAVLRLLRPAEAAARRLVIMAARGIVVALPRPRLRKPKAKSAFLRNGPRTGIGTGILMPRGALLPQALTTLPRAAPRTLSLPLFDPLRQWGGRLRPAAGCVPRISFPGFSAPCPVPVRRPLSPHDPIDAARLALRLSALVSALDDLPAHARRFARWRTRRDLSLGRGLVRRMSPLRPGRPPGQRPAKSRRPVHEVHEVLGDLQWFAFKALEQPDTS